MATYAEHMTMWSTGHDDPRGCKVYFWNMRAGEGSMEYAGTFVNKLCAIAYILKYTPYQTGNVNRGDKQIATVTNGTIYTHA